MHVSRYSVRIVLSISSGRHENIYTVIGHEVEDRGGIETINFITEERMSVFKVKDSKKRPPKKSTYTNLSTIHQQKIEEFRKDRGKEKQMLAYLKQLNDEIEKLELNECKTISELRDIVSLRDKREDIRGCLERLTNYEDMMEYYYNTSDIISAYNELEEDPCKVTVSVTDFFRDYTVSDENSSVKKKAHNNKRDLLEEYLEVTRPDYIRSVRAQDFTFCETCEEEMTLKKDHGIYICTSCGRTNSVLVEADSGKISLPEGVKYSIYQRKNHFREWLNQIQAKESTDIPTEVLDMIVLELNKIHFENLAELNPSLIRNILKKLNLSRYYENVFHIIYRLNGLQPPTLSREVEERLLTYFKQIEEPFRLYKKEGRKNILRYSYILYKLCELLELDEFLRCFRLLKNRTKLIEQDTVWASICKHLGWEFIPSM